MAEQEKKVFIKTYGCQMNVYDSERMAEVLAENGFSETAEMDGADLIVLNTCHIREKAAEKVYSELGRIRRIKSERLERGHSTKIAVAGCVAQAEGVEIIKRAPIVDFVVGPQSYHRLGEMLDQPDKALQYAIETEFPGAEKFQKQPLRRKSRSASAFLTIQEGCDKFCTFCVVPYTRGAEYSRTYNEIIKEARELLNSGVREITLLGQNVNAYHGDMPDGSTGTLARLIYGLAELDGLERLRYTTSHPTDMSPDLIRAHGEVDKLMPYLHLPFQSGSDRVLAAMNRKHTSSDYRKIVDEIRQVRPDIALSTDIIVGFPDETDKEFDDTIKLVEAVEFAQAYSFKYSARPGTPAANILVQISEQKKNERLQILQSLLNEQQTRFNRSCINRVLPVLFDRKGRENGQIVGRSPYQQSVNVFADSRYVGNIVDVEIETSGPNSLKGVIKSATEPAILDIVLS